MQPHPVSSQVYYLGEGETSKQWLQQEQNSLAKLCLSHMRAVARHVWAQHPGTTPLVWDDMLRDIPQEQLKGWQGLCGWGLTGGCPRPAPEALEVSP